mmetsp:Transcript_72999/g.158438  ORF Transcript_72999/g.158438 Transcript_72999/m.158438 type:complete len:215 (+) Transcript_72999:1637-2281(+)
MDSAAASMTALNVWMSCPMSFLSTRACSRAEPCIFRSRILMARSNVSMASVSSFSLASKSVFSLERISAAAFMSASFVAMAAPRPSALDSSDATSLSALAIVAVSPSMELLAVTISNSRSLAPPLHQSTYSSKDFCSASPSLIIFCSSWRRSVTTFWTGLTPRWAAETWTLSTASTPEKIAMRAIRPRLIALLWRRMVKPASRQGIHLNQTLQA